MLRGEALDYCNIIEYFVNTYEDDVDRRDRDQEDEEDVDLMSNEHRRPGRPRNERIDYLPSYPKYNKKLRIKRTHGHNQLPYFIGRYFPRADDPDIREFYCANMLLLLKPWRNIHTDSKMPTESWSAAFTRFLSVASKKEKDIIGSIQYFYESHAAAEEERDRDPDEDDESNGRRHRLEPRGDEYELGEDAEIADDIYSEEGLAALLASQVPLREELHGRYAVERAKYAKIFTRDLSKWDVNHTSASASIATGDDLVRLIGWKKQMIVSVQVQNSGLDPPQPVDNIRVDDRGDVACLSIPDPSEDRAQVALLDKSASSESALNAVDVKDLKADQFRAYDIIAWHLDQTLAGDKPPPLRMIIHGEGGTGKSRVIQTVAEYSVRQGAQHLLKAAYTGVAASLIDGKTTHVIGMILTSGRPMGDETTNDFGNIYLSYNR